MLPFSQERLTLSYCVTTVIFRGSLREPQTIDSGSSHYSTLFKEHPRFTARNPLPPFPFMRIDTQKPPANVSALCIGMVNPDSSVESSGSRPPTSNSPSQDRSDRTALSNIASILCLSMLFSKISGKKPDTFEKNTPSHAPSPSSQGSLNDHSRKTSESNSESSG